MKWISCLPTQVDRIACAWLIKRFIDLEAEFIFVPKEKITDYAEKLGAIPYGVPGLELPREGEICIFDNLLAKYDLQDKVFHQLATIVRGAEFDFPDLTNRIAGRSALSTGPPYLTHDAHTMMENKLEIFEALYSWGKLVSDKKTCLGPKVV